MNRKIIRELDYFVAWLLFFLCTTIGGAIIGGIAGGIMGVIVAANGGDIEDIQLIGTILGFALGLPISYFMFRVFVGIFIVGKMEKSLPPQYLQQDEYGQSYMRPPADQPYAPPHSR